MSEAKLTLAFDIYGTLVDPHGMEEHLKHFFGAMAEQASKIWREKQIEYSFRRALMKRYVDFDTCTAQALIYVSGAMGVALSAADRQSLLERYRSLPCFPDAPAALAALAGRGHDLVAFSNGTERAVRGLLEKAGLLNRFRMVVSVDDVRSFKPDPAVYAHLVQRAGADSTAVWMISSNPFDVIGATAYGLRSVWVRRDQNRIFDPWEFAPAVEVGTLLDLPGALGLF